MTPNPQVAAPSQAAGIAELLCARLSQQRLLGIELEMSLLRESDLQPARYEGPSGVAGLLHRLIRERGFQPVYEGEQVIALDHADGTAITLEPGGQFELATRPWTTLAGLEQGMLDAIRPLAAAAAEEGLWLLGGSLALAPQEAAPWMPKGRYRLMREHFAALGEAGQHARVMMQRTLSTQVSLDYRDAADGAELLRAAFLLAPLATAVFANSPFDGLEESGFLSFRAEAWRFTDPARCGDVERCMRPESTLLDWVDFFLDAPPMFRVRDGDYVAPGTTSFRAVLDAGHWPDGTPVTVQDVWYQLSGVFPNARAKPGLVELRSTDGQRFPEIGTIPAFWTGLLYDDPSRAQVLELLGDVSYAEHQATQAEVPAKALDATWQGRPLLELAREVLAIARAGLERRNPEAVALLEPVERRVAAGRTPAHELLEAWRGELGRDPRKLAERLRFDV